MHFQPLSSDSFSMRQKRLMRLQVMLTIDELATLDDWRFRHRMPSRAEAVRSLLRRGLGLGGRAHVDSVDSRHAGQRARK